MDMNINISYRSSQLLKAFFDQKKDFFTLKDAVKIFQVRKILLRGSTGDKAKHKGYEPKELITEIPEFNDAWREMGKHWRKFQKFIE
jgi:hypothetical protein